MTKVSVFGQQPTETKELKKIEFVKYLDGNRVFDDASNNAHEWDNVQLFSKSQHGNLDVIIAWDNDLSHKSIILGHWNDGIV